MQLDSTRSWQTARGATAVDSETERTERSEARASSRERLTVSDATHATLAAGILVALTTTDGSLHLSLGLRLTPCDLCWYQRILMYPLVVVLRVTAVGDRPDVRKVVLPLSLNGLTLSAYRSHLQVAPGAACTVGSPCTSTQYSMPGGLLAVPRLAFIGFALVTILAVAMARIDGETDDAWGI